MGLKESIARMANFAAPRSAAAVVVMAATTGEAITFAVPNKSEISAPKPVKPRASLTTAATPVSVHICHCCVVVIAAGWSFAFCVYYVYFGVCGNNIGFTFFLRAKQPGSVICMFTFTQQVLVLSTIKEKPSHGHILQTICMSVSCVEEKCSGTHSKQQHRLTSTEFSLSQGPTLFRYKIFSCQRCAKTIRMYDKRTKKFGRSE